MILQATNPASQEMVIFHMMSVRTEMRPTNRSAAAKCLIKKFIRDLRPLNFWQRFFFLLPQTLSYFLSGLKVIFSEKGFFYMELFTFTK